jgi:hypothetical protein
VRSLARQDLTHHDLRREFLGPIRGEPMPVPAPRIDLARLRLAARDRVRRALRAPRAGSRVAFVARGGKAPGAKARPA